MALVGLCAVARLFCLSTFVSHFVVMEMAEVAIEKVTSADSCGICLTEECILNRLCPLVCKEKCPQNFYRVRLYNGGCQNVVYSEGKKPSKRAALSIPDQPATEKALETTTTTTTTTTTPAPIRYLCQNCTLIGCNRCRDDVDTALCEKCHPEYFLDNSTSTCVAIVAADDALSGGAIAGIVIGILCLLGFASLGIILVLRITQRRLKSKKGHITKDQNGDGSGAKISHVKARSPKISKEELLPKDDQAVCYTPDPTCKKRSTKKKYDRSKSCETSDIDDLGIAPPPPNNTCITMTAGSDYSGLLPEDPNENGNYEPLEDHHHSQYITNPAQGEADNVYVNNVGALGNEKCSPAKPGRSASSKRKQFATETSKSDAIYDPVECRDPGDQTENIYGNDDICKLVLNDHHGVTDQIYNNEPGVSTDLIYENTN